MLGLLGSGSRLAVNLLHQFGQDLFEPPVTDERGGGDLGEPPFNMRPLICFARVGVILGEIAGVAGEHAIALDILTSRGERDEMVDAGSDFAIPVYAGQTNAAVG